MTICCSFSFPNQTLGLVSWENDWKYCSCRLRSQDAEIWGEISTTIINTNKFWHRKEVIMLHRFRVRQQLSIWWNQKPEYNLNPLTNTIWLFFSIWQWSYCGSALCREGLEESLQNPTYTLHFTWQWYWDLSGTH